MHPVAQETLNRYVQFLDIIYLSGNEAQLEEIIFLYYASQTRRCKARACKWKPKQPKPPEVLWNCINKDNIQGHRHENKKEIKYRR